MILKASTRARPYSHSHNRTRKHTNTCKRKHTSTQTHLQTRAAHAKAHGVHVDVVVERVGVLARPRRRVRVLEQRHVDGDVAAAPLANVGGQRGEALVGIHDVIVQEPRATHGAVGRQIRLRVLTHTCAQAPRSQSTCLIESDSCPLALIRNIAMNGTIGISIDNNVHTQLRSDNASCRHVPRRGYTATVSAASLGFRCASSSFRL